jgi:hypothetical protein
VDSARNGRGRDSGVASFDFSVASLRIDVSSFDAARRGRGCDSGVASLCVGIASFAVGAVSLAGVSCETFFAHSLDVLGFFLKLPAGDSLCSRRIDGSADLSCPSSRCMSGASELDRPLNIDSDVFSRKLGCRNVLAIVFDRLGTSVVPLAVKVCDGVSSGCSCGVVDALWRPVTGMVTPGMLTPPTWRASNGPEMVMVRGLVIAFFPPEGLGGVGVTGDD